MVENTIVNTPAARAAIERWENEGGRSIAKLPGEGASDGDAEACEPAEGERDGQLPKPDPGSTPPSSAGATADDAAAQP